MIWFGLALAVALLFGVSAWRYNGDSLDGTVMFVLSAAIGGSIALILSLVVGLNLYEKDTYEYSFDIVAAKDGSSMHGSFSIFGGFIDEEPYYFFYRQYADGSIRQGKISADHTAIFEDQETRNYVEVTKCDSHLWFWGFVDGCDPSYEIHVPAGSVRQEIEFDLE